MAFFEKVWAALLELARFLWDSREARRRPGGASRGGAFKSREGEKKREFPAARGENRGGPRQTESTRGALRRPGGGKGGQRETPAEMRRHAFCGAWLERPPGALALAFERGGWGLLESRRCGEKPWGSQESQSTPGHPGERAPKNQP